MSHKIQIETTGLDNFEDILAWLRENVGNGHFDWLITNKIMTIWIDDEVAASVFKLKWAH